MPSCAAQQKSTEPNLQPIEIMTNPTSSNRIQIDGEGVGEIGDDAIFRRAQEIATSDGRDQPNEIDNIKALQELSRGGQLPRAPEVTRSTENLTARDEIHGESGTRAVRHFPDDETASAEQLVNEGLSEAERDSRRVAEERRKESS